MSSIKWNSLAFLMQQSSLAFLACGSAGENFILQVSQRELKTRFKTGAPNDNFWKISVRKTIWDLEFSEHLL